MLPTRRQFVHAATYRLYPLNVEIRSEEQLNPVADEVSAITAVVRPILLGILYSLKKDVVGWFGDYTEVTLEQLARNRRAGDGDTGICFEYAAHDAISRGEASVVERVHDALKLCKVPGNATGSILFGAEKQGSQSLIDTASSLLTPDSQLLYGGRGRPAKLRRHLDAAYAAFRKKGVGSALPYSIGGLWRADLFLGSTDKDYWVGTTVKINPSGLKYDRGLRIGLVPAGEGKSDLVRMDDKNKLVVCPLPYDGAFVETFYKGWEVVTAFFASAPNVPKEVALPRPAARTVARYLADRSAYPVVEVVEALASLAQPELLKTETAAVNIIPSGGKTVELVTSAVLAPRPTGI